MNQIKELKLGQPVIIAQSAPLPQNQDNWGPFQFPAIERLSDNRLCTEYHIRKDSAKAYGMSKGHAVSRDKGMSWESVDEEGLFEGILLDNGDRLRLKYLPALDEASAGIIGEPDDVVMSYCHINRIYSENRFSPESNRWPMERQPAGSREWVLEMKEIKIPHMARYTSEGVFPQYMFWRLKKGPNGRVWAITYYYMLTGQKPAKIYPIFCVSEDYGHSFQYLSHIPYEPNPEFDPLFEKRGGFGEPDIAFMKDGSVLCLLRTTDGHGIGPSYICHSYDKGATWTKPMFFDDNGVWPTLLTLGNGATLAVYGRPGLYLRTTWDESGRRWDDRIAIVPPGEYQQDTCSYADLIALDDNTAYVVYSDFKYPDKDGIPVKTILGRRIEFK